MKSEININNKVSLGIDTGLIGIGIGCILNIDTRIFAITLFGFYFIITLPRTLGKIKTYKMYSEKLAKVNGEFIPVILHSTFKPKYITARNSNGKEFEESTRFKLIEDDNGFSGAIIYFPNSTNPKFYRTDEIQYFYGGEIVKGFIHNRKLYILSIVD